MTFNLHEVRWTPELISRFWDAMSRSPLAADNYFSQQIGGALVHFVRRHVSLGNKVLDYGAGQGHLTSELLKQGTGQVYACEFSEASAEQLMTRFQREPRFGGCALVKNGRVDFPDNEFDMVFLVETIEHLLPDIRESTLREIRRLLRSGGVLVVTTPNNERLLDSLAICPECGAMFHRMQHVVAFNCDTLTDVLEAAGFHTIYCGAVQLDHFQPNLGWRGVYRRWRYRNRARPHLIFIGKKP